MNEKKLPQRLCIGCNEFRNKKELIRIVRTAEDNICLDTTGRKNGRGAYICRNRDCLDKAVKNRGLERAFKTAVSREVYEELIKEWSEQIEQG